MIGEHSTGKGSASRIRGEENKKYNNSKLWENLDRNKKKKMLKEMKMECNFCGSILHLDLLTEVPSCMNNKCTEFMR